MCALLLDGDWHLVTRTNQKARGNPASTVAPRAEKSPLSQPQDSSWGTQETGERHLISVAGQELLHLGPSSQILNQGPGGSYGFQTTLLQSQQYLLPSTEVWGPDKGESVLRREALPTDGQLVTGTQECMAHREKK